MKNILRHLKLEIALEISASREENIVNNKINSEGKLLVLVHNISMLTNIFKWVFFKFQFNYNSKQKYL